MGTCATTILRTFPKTCPPCYDANPANPDTNPDPNPSPKRAKTGQKRGCAAFASISSEVELTANVFTVNVELRITISKCGPRLANYEDKNSP